MTENENWREDSGNEYTGTNREGNQYNNREGRYNRPSYNNREGRPYRPRINAEGGERQPRNYGSSERPFRPRFNGNNGRGGYNNNKRNSRPRTADYNPHAKYSKKKQIEFWVYFCKMLVAFSHPTVL